MPDKQTFVIKDKAIRHRAVSAVSEITGEPLMQVVISEYKSGRSLAQNKMMWMWLGEIRNHLAETTGEQYTNEELHEFFKDKFLDRRPIIIKGDVRVIHGSTAQLNVSDMSEYLNRLDIYCADDLDLTLSHPDDLYHEAHRL